MSDYVLVSSLSVALSLVLLVGLYALFRDYRVDSVRDQLFALRDELFIYAYEQELSESVAHTNLRMLMNGMIRYAHQISFFRLVLLYHAKKIAGVKANFPTEHVEWMKAISELPTEQRMQFERFYTTAMLLVIKHMIVGSPVLLPAAVLMAVCVMIRHRTKMLFDATATAMNDRLPSLSLFEAEAYKSARSA